MQDASTNGRITGATLSQISNGLVQLYARHYGKGPTRAKTSITGDIVICVFRDAFTPVERTLVDNGHAEMVEGMRAAFHRVMEADSRRIIEENCGRQVIACLAATHVDPDIAVEIFVLEAPDEYSPSLDAAPPVDA